MTFDRLSICCSQLNDRNNNPDMIRSLNQDAHVIIVYIVVDKRIKYLHIKSSVTVALKGLVRLEFEA